MTQENDDKPKTETEPEAEEPEREEEPSESIVSSRGPIAGGPIGS